MNDAICVKNVSKKFGQKIIPRWFAQKEKDQPFVAVNNVSFTVRRGEVFGILGHNGSGKSTLIRMLATLLVPDTGTITIFGVDVRKDLAAVRQMINRVSVEASFVKSLSARANLIYAGRLYGLAAKDALAKATTILEELSFPLEKIDDPITAFSRGLQQKIAIARGLMSTPMVVLLDEPTTGLDPTSKRDVIVYLKKLLAERDLTIVLTSHDMHEVEQLCDRVAMMKDGKIVMLDTVPNIKKRFETEGEYILKTSDRHETCQLLREQNVPHRSNGTNEILFAEGQVKKVMCTVLPSFRERNIGLQSFQRKVLSLEEVFQRMMRN